MILHFKCHFCGVVVVVFLSILSFCIYTLRRKGVVEVLPFGHTTLTGRTSIYAFPLSAVGSSAGCFNFLAASFLYSVRDVM